MKPKLILLLSIICANAFAASQIAEGSLAWAAYPGNQSKFPRVACLVDYIGSGPGLGAECVGTAACTPGSFFNRTTVNTSSAVQEYCTVASGPMQLHAEGNLPNMQNHLIASSAILKFTKAGWFTGARYSVFHESYDDCNQEKRYDNTPMTKPCWQPI